MRNNITTIFELQRLLCYIVGHVFTFDTIYHELYYRVRDYGSLAENDIDCQLEKGDFHVKAMERCRKTANIRGEQWVINTKY